MLVLTCGFRYFWEETSGKGCAEIEHWGFFVHFALGLEENFIYTLRLCLSQDITKWCKVYTKANSWFQKSHEEFEQFQTSSGKFKKLKFDWLLFPKKNSFSWNIYRGFIWRYFQLLVWKFTKLLISFCKPWVIFHSTTPLYLFSSNIAYLLQK